MNVFILWSTFLLGILGSVHCLGMCGPLALSLPFAVQSGNKWRSIIIYYLAKASAYSMMGGVMGILGKGIMLMKWQQALSVAAGAFILLMALLPALKHTRVHFIFQKQFLALHTRLQQHPRKHYYFFMGFLNGLLPCGLVYTALTTALLAGSVAGGALAMLLFGLGTIPVMILLLFFKQRINLPLRKRLLPLSTFFSVAIGALLVLRGLNLGLPYISPQAEKDKVTNCCHQ
jgi:sulfite exporter TauE/SafE